MENQEIRKKAVDSARQVIVKAGTRLLTSRESIAELVSGIALLRRAGKKVLLVSSGAVGMGMELLKIPRRPRDLAAKQALAAVGQTRLMAIYAEECAKYGFLPAQLLLTAADLNSRSRYLNVMNCINALWEKELLPVINENDPVSVAELKFGDNDKLAGLLCSLTGSELAVILTTEDGLRDRNPDGTLGARIPLVPKITPAVKALAGGTDNADYSVGGMSSKLLAASIATAAGAALWIADGRKKGILEKILAGEDEGTLFTPGERIPGRKRYLRYFSSVTGRLVIDAGAAEALLVKGKSLLSSGVTAVTGEFKRGDTVEIADGAGPVIARGLVNFSAAECRKVAGKSSRELHKILGTQTEDEVIHRNNLTLMDRPQD